MTPRNGPNPPPLQGRYDPRFHPLAQAVRSMQALLVVAVVLGFPLFVWYGCRIEPGAGEIAVLLRKTGEPLPPGEIIAPTDRHQGIQIDPLPEGRHFRNPYTWGWEIARITDIPAGKVGVLTRLYGKDLPHGRIIAEPGTKGIVPETLGPGKYRINPYAFIVEQFNAIAIRPGHVGVMISLIGDDVLDGQVPDERRSTFLIERGMKGVLPEVIDPGTYYLNPYMVSVAEVNLQSQRFEMSGDDVISFLTEDGFTVTVEGTIEFAIRREHAALLTHRVGDMEDIVKKIIMPRARGFSRIEGSKHPAINFIVGQTRQEFQSQLESHLRDRTVDWGVDVKSVLIRRIVVPDEIASITREREMAVQEARKYDQQIEQARSKAELAKQEMLAQQNKEKVEADTLRIKAVIAAQQEQAVQVVAAEKELDVAKVRRQAVASQAEALVLKAEGERDAIQKKNEAEAAVLAAQTQAFGSGMNYARHVFYRRVAPRIRSVLAGDGQDGLGALFGPYLPREKEVSR